MIILIEKMKKITLKGNQHLEIIAGKKIVKPGGGKANQAIRCKANEILLEYGKERIQLEY